MDTARREGAVAGTIAQMKALQAERQLYRERITGVSVTALRGLKQLANVPVIAGEPTEIDV